MHTHAHAHTQTHAPYLIPSHPSFPLCAFVALPPLVCVCVMSQILAALSTTEGADDSSSISIDDIHRIFGIMDSTSHSPEVGPRALETMFPVYPSCVGHPPHLHGCLAAL
jgi:hypothetical protein